jgi:ankyrin repeat protein
LLTKLGADHDCIDFFNQTPLYYAIKSYKLEVFKWLLQQGVNLQIVDKKGQGLMRFAAKHNRHNMKDILAQNGSLNQSSRDDRRSNQKSVPSDQHKFKNVKTNERMQKKTYVLQVYDG